MHWNAADWASISMTQSETVITHKYRRNLSSSWWSTLHSILILCRKFCTFSEHLHYRRAQRGIMRCGGTALCCARNILMSSCMAFALWLLSYSKFTRWSHLVEMLNRSLWIHWTPSVKESTSGQLPTPLFLIEMVLEIWAWGQSGTVLKGQGLHHSKFGLRGSLAYWGGLTASGSIRAQIPSASAM